MHIPKGSMKLKLHTQPKKTTYGHQLEVQDGQREICKNYFSGLLFAQRHQIAITTLPVIWIQLAKILSQIPNSLTQLLLQLLITVRCTKKKSFSSIRKTLFSLNAKKPLLLEIMFKHLMVPGLSTVSSFVISREHVISKTRRTKMFLLPSLLLELEHKIGMKVLMFLLLSFTFKYILVQATSFACILINLAGLSKLVTKKKV